MKNKKITNNGFPIAKRTIGDYPVRDATQADGIISLIVGPKDWARGIKNNATKCAGARALARALGLTYEEVLKYGLAILSRIAYVPSFDKNGDVEILRYRVGTDMHTMWDQGKLVKPYAIKLNPMTKSQMFDAKRAYNKARTKAIKAGTHKPFQRKKRIAKAGQKTWHARGEYYNHHSCVELETAA